jgi:hypothetical protein
MKKIIRWIVINSLFVIAMYYAFVENINGAQNIVQFYAWFAFVIGLLALHPSAAKTLAASPEKLSPTWVRTIDVLYDTVCVIVFVWVGWQITAVAYLLHIVFMQHLQTKARDLIFEMLKEGELAS